MCVVCKRDMYGYLKVYNNNYIIFIFFKSKYNKFIYLNFYVSWVFMSFFSYNGFC